MALSLCCLPQPESWTSSPCLVVDWSHGNSSWGRWMHRSSNDLSQVGPGSLCGRWPMACEWCDWAGWRAARIAPLNQGWGWSGSAHTVGRKALQGKRSLSTFWFFKSYKFHHQIQQNCTNFCLKHLSHIMHQQVHITIIFLFSIKFQLLKLFLK